MAAILARKNFKVNFLNKKGSMPTLSKFHSSFGPHHFGKFLTIAGLPDPPISTNHHKELFKELLQQINKCLTNIYLCDVFSLASQNV